METGKMVIIFHWSVQNYFQYEVCKSLKYANGEDGDCQEIEERIVEAKNNGLECGALPSLKPVILLNLLRKKKRHFLLNRLDFSFNNENIFCLSIFSFKTNEAKCNFMRNGHSLILYYNGRVM